MKRAIPTRNQLQVLQVLAAHARPLMSREIRDRTGLLSSEFQVASTWLKQKGFVACEVKRVKVLMWDNHANKSMAFWSLTEKGRVYVDTARALEAGSGAAAVAQDAGST